MKLLASAIVMLLATPVLADVAPKSGYALNVQVKSKATVLRQHAIAVVADDCAELSERETDHVDDIRVCAMNSTRDQVTLKIEWSTVAGNASYRNKQSLIVARGSSYTIGSTSTTHLVIDVK
jgi:hypothetical protein